MLVVCKERYNSLSRKFQSNVASTYTTMIITSNPDATELNPIGTVSRVNITRRAVRRELRTRVRGEVSEGELEVFSKSFAIPDVDFEGRQNDRTLESRRLPTWTRIAAHIKDPRKIQYCLRYLTCF
jgi:hypothetical protein